MATREAIKDPGNTPFNRIAASAGVCLFVASLAACGSGSSYDSVSALDAAADDQGGSAADTARADTESAELADIVATPTFHRQPAALMEPDGIDEDGLGASAFVEPKSVETPPEMAGLQTKQLTDEKIAEFIALPDDVKAVAKAAADEFKATMLKATPVVYTPAQIRAAYRMPAIPAKTTSLTAAAAASLGAGQTIYVLAAYHNPNTAADLERFNQKFGLPLCTTVAAPKTAAKLAAPAATSGCGIMVAYSAAGGAITAKAPAYNSGWAGEIALDVQWAHAIAPMARIVVIEAASPTLAALSDAVKLANKMGPGVVTMSFGALEGSWVTSANSVFSGTGMTYLAATGDSGYAVSWPAVAPNVLGVGGTTLNYTSAGTRSEVTWSGTGGGISAYVPLPAYQKSLTIAGQRTTGTKYRGVADLSFNADPYTGQYVAITAPGSKVTNWYSFGGTSMSSPQLAGIVAVANAQRAVKKLAPLGVLNTALYTRFAPKSTNWTQSFNDVTSGKNGSCTGCVAVAGYDIPTGLGTPRTDFFLSVLATK